MKIGAETFGKIMGKQNLYIGIESCRVYEELNLNRCYNFNGYCHNRENGMLKKNCMFYVGEHGDWTIWDNNSNECINCIRFN